METFSDSSMDRGMWRSCEKVLFPNPLPGTRFTFFGMEWLAGFRNLSQQLSKVKDDAGVLDSVRAYFVDGTDSDPLIDLWDWQIEVGEGAIPLGTAV